MRISNYDLGVIISYFILMLVIGWVTRKYVANTSDYFRGGGQMLWWMTGASVFMTQFSAWSFTGAASMAYLNGPVILTIFFANGLGFFMSYLYFAPKLRQLRVITPIEAVRLRFGKGSEQFFTWISIPMGMLFAGIWLNALAVFLSAVFGLPLQLTIVFTGLIVMFYSAVGGSWAVVMSDFMQTLLLMLIAVVMAVFALIAVGGPIQLVDRFPAQNIVLGNDYNYAVLIVGWMVFIFIRQFVSTNNIMEATRYLTAKDSHNARKAALMASLLMFIGPVIWFIPPMAAQVLYPDLSTIFPQLGSRASEGAYVAIAMEKLPMGMMGLLIAGMFAATMSSMDSGLNRNAGIFVRNFYLPILRPGASEGEQMLLAKSISVVLGFGIIGIAFWYSTLTNLGLFDLMLQFSALVGLPISIPLVLMLVVRRTPDWAGWATVVVGLTLSYVVRVHFNATWFSETFSLGFTPREISTHDTMMAIAVNVTIPPLFFLCTRFFYREPTGDRAHELKVYWDNLARPALASENAANTDSRQGTVLGTLAAFYGGFLILLMVIPNDWTGRLVFLACGTVLFLLAYALWRSTRPHSAGA